ncbi:AAA family ATPase [Gracilibacillus salinarum]|uniref:AAA family ATPase n=1 Tax=Gracilibacillus salinarum TaxID=2932255 RepID=A0ABY4GHA5_9BACI|nr:AAA family ATPase [Gracilibacillus salinarum]UOQ83637.1 AAA family ATPase [Gracilibacillus salinarum]
MSDQFDILIVSEEDSITTQVLNAIDRDENNVTVIGSKDVSREINRQTRDFVIFIQENTDYVVEQVQYVKSIHSPTYVIFLATDSDIGLLRNIMRAGAEEFFILPDELSLFFSRFPTMQKNYKLRMETDKDNAVVFGRGRGQIHAFYSGKGGTGKTVISSTYAQTIKLESAAEVILIDLNVQFGGIETIMSLETNRSLIDLQPVINELNESHIRNVSQTEQHSKLEVLISPTDAGVAETIDGEFISRLLRACRRSFDFCIIDLPSFVNENTVTAIEEADKIYYVLQPDTPSLKVLKHFEEISERLGIDLKTSMQIILNNMSKEMELKEKDVKDLVRYPIAATVRRDYKKLQTFINKGDTIRKAQKEKLIPFSKDIRKFAKSVLS